MSRLRRAPVTLPSPPLSPTATWRPRSVGSVPQGGPCPHRRDQLGVVLQALESQQLVEGCSAQDAIGGQPGVALELSEGACGGVAEDAVDPARVEAQAAQALLQLGDVVTPQHGRPAVEEAVTQREAGLDQGVPGLRTADTVDAQSAQALEGFDRGPRGGSEQPVDVDRRAQDLAQTVLDVGDRRPPVPDDEGEAYR